MVIIPGRNKWITNLFTNLDRNSLEITFNEHVFKRVCDRNFDLDKVEETVRKGRLWLKKCEYPDKLCFVNYYGKENTTYVVIALVKKYSWEVVTAWLRSGR